MPSIPYHVQGPLHLDVYACYLSFNSSRQRRPRGREHLDRDARNPSRAKRAWGYDNSSTLSLSCFEDARERANFQQVEVEKYYTSLARFALPGSTIYWTL